MATSELHFVLVPLAAQGHIIPMADVARLRSSRRAAPGHHRHHARQRRAQQGHRRRRQEGGLPVELVELPFPGPRLGLPEGMEAVDQLTGLEPGMYLNFFQAIWVLAEPQEEYVRGCLVADACNPWTGAVCGRLGIPRLVMHCPSAYFQLAVPCLTTHGVYDRVGDDDLAPFEVPDFPVRAVGNKAWRRSTKTCSTPRPPPTACSSTRSAASRACTLINAYGAALGKRTWAVGPTCASSSMADDADAKAGSGKPADVDAGHIVSWLDARPTASVLYISFGSISQLTAKQLRMLQAVVDQRKKILIGYLDWDDQVYISLLNE